MSVTLVNQDAHHAVTRGCLPLEPCSGYRALSNTYLKPGQRYLHQTKLLLTSTTQYYLHPYYVTWAALMTTINQKGIWELSAHEHILYLDLIHIQNSTKFLRLMCLFDLRYIRTNHEISIDTTLNCFG